MVSVGSGVAVSVGVLLGSGVSVAVGVMVAVGVKVGALAVAAATVAAAATWVSSRSAWKTGVATVPQAAKIRDNRLSNMILRLILESDLSLHVATL